MHIRNRPSSTGSNHSVYDSNVGKCTWPGGEACITREGSAAEVLLLSYSAASLCISTRDEYVQ